MTSRRKMLWIVGLFLVVLTGMRLIWFNWYMDLDYPKAVGGVLDLRGWELPENRSITLDGEWEFYPRVLLQDDPPHVTEPSTAVPAARTIVHIPGEWNAFLQQDADMPFGYGSYRLKVQLDSGQTGPYGIRISSARSSSELFVNGQSVGRSGMPAVSAEQYELEDIPYSAFFQAEDGELDIVIHVASFHDARKGGIARSVKFGTESALRHETQLFMAIQLIVSAFLLFHAIYAVLVYLFGTRSISLLYCALIILCVVPLYLSLGDKILHIWLPLPYETRFTYLPMLIAAGSFFLFQSLRTFMPGFWPKWLVRSYSLVSAGAVVLPLLMTVKQNSAILPGYILLAASVCLMAFFLVFRLLLTGTAQNLLMILVVVTALNTLAWLLIVYFSERYVLPYPIDLLLGLTLFASIWLRRVSSMFKEMEVLTVRLREEDRGKDEFLANTSHELRNPLNGMLNITDTVLQRERHVLTKESASDLELLKNVGRRMAIMLNDLLDIARLKEKRIVLQPSATSVQAVADTVIGMLRTMTDGKAIHLGNDIPDTFPPVWADENRLFQILYNLMHNAVKFTDEGFVKVEASVVDGQARIAVVDSGYGIGEKLLKRVFEPYEQGEEGQLGSRASGGFGLGLNICKQLVELHGSKLELHTIEGEGSTFAFALPISVVSAEKLDDGWTVKEAEGGGVESAAHTVAVADGTGAAQSSAARLRVLAVDDDPVNLKVLKHMFTGDLYAVHTASSGEEALAMLDRECEWDLVLSDVMMPRMSGYELTQRIRERYTGYELPVLLITARSQDADIEAGFLAGANDYVTKPVNGMELRARVRSLTGLKQAVSERLRIEAAWLQAQIKPHFIMNTFNIVAALSYSDPERMSRLVEQICNYLRVSIDFQNSDRLTSLDRELDLVRSYLFIEQERFGARLNVMWEVETRARAQLPPLTIQPLVENAVRHGVLKRARGGTVGVRITETDGTIAICVFDDGVGIVEEKLQQIWRRKADTRTGIGLYNTDRRLKHYYGRGLELVSRPGEGTRVSFEITK